MDSYHSSQLHAPLSPRKKRAIILWKKTEPHSRFCVGPGADLEKNRAHLEVADRTPQKFSCIFHILLTIREREFCGVTERFALVRNDKYGPP
jgi:hypothetical protein